MIDVEDIVTKNTYTAHYSAFPYAATLARFALTFSIIINDTNGEAKDMILSGAIAEEFKLFVLNVFERFGLPFNNRYKKFSIESNGYETITLYAETDDKSIYKVFRIVDTRVVYHVVLRDEPPMMGPFFKKIIDSQPDIFFNIIFL